MHSWEDDVREERQVLDRRWEELKAETCKVAVRWEELKRGEEQLAAERELFNEQRSGVLVKLSKERAKLFEEAEELTASARAVRRREDDVAAAEEALARARKEQAAREARLAQQALELQAALEQVERRHTHPPLPAVDVLPLGDPAPLQRLQHITAQFEGRHADLAAREALLEQNEARFAAMVRAAEATYARSPALARPRGAAAAAAAEPPAPQAPPLRVQPPPPASVPLALAPRAATPQSSEGGVCAPLPHFVSRISAVSEHGTSAPNTSSHWMSPEELDALTAGDRRASTAAGATHPGAPAGPDDTDAAVAAFFSVPRDPEAERTTPVQDSFAGLPVGVDATRSPAAQPPPSASVDIASSSGAPAVTAAAAMDPTFDVDAASTDTSDDDDVLCAIDDPEIRALLSAELRASRQRVSAMAAQT